MPTTPENIAWRLGKVEQRVDHLEESKADAIDLTDLTVEFRGLRKTLTGLLFTIAASTLTFAGGVVGIVFTFNLHH